MVHLTCSTPLSKCPRNVDSDIGNPTLLVALLPALTTKVTLFEFCFYLCQRVASCVDVHVRMPVQ